LDVLFGVEILRAQRQPFFGGVAGEIILGQVRPISRRIGIVADHDDLPAVSFAPQSLGGGEARRAAADDHNIFRGRFRRRNGASTRNRPPAFPHHYLVAAPLDLPAREGAEGGRR
jgi:hypothetical protein